LKDHGVSIEKLHQPGQNDDGTASVVMVTHEVGHKAMREGVAELKKLSSIVNTPKLLRLEEI
ncbi:MAG: homoserine dehydrogenase, partial [Alphaproteobacteria bacterium]|nr:homoserine dehydrogenase [Alphaproteobacteria bacterium]